MNELELIGQQVSADHRNARQTGYQILVSNSPIIPESTPTDSLWNTSKVASSHSLHIPYDGRTLQAGQRCYWWVRVWDEGEAYDARLEKHNWDQTGYDDSLWERIRILDHPKEIVVDQVEGVLDIREEGTAVLLTIGSGHYQFSTPWES